ncbi:cell division protein SepF [bacterium]|nr:cell division protein SepF [bacterium]
MSAEIWSKVKNFVGLDQEFEEVVDEEEATVDPKITKQAKSSNLVGLPSASQSELVVLEPHSFDDALGIIENLRSRRAVILNLQGLTDIQSQRLVDFVSGACHALDGHQERIGEAIFLFTPSNVKINALSNETQWMVSQAQQPQQSASKDLFWRVR